MKTVLDEEIKRGTFPGVVMLVEKEGRIIHSMHRGHKQLFPHREPMTPDTMFDLASLTKPLATTIICLHILHKSKIELDRRIADFLPDIAYRAREITIRQLLLHTSGLPPLPDVYKEFPDPGNIDLQRAERKLLAVEPTETPGSAVVYSCTGYLLLGLLLRSITGKRLGDLFTSIIVEPCGITDLCFRPSEKYLERIAATEFCAWRKRWIRGEVHDENSYCFGGDGGNAGLFGSAGSVMQLLALFTSGGCLGKTRILEPEAVELMTTCQTEGLNLRRAIGFTMQDKDSKVGPLYSSISFGHSGFTGTSVWIDPEKQLKIVLLSNRVHLGRDSTESKLARFRRRIHTGIYRGSNQDEYKSS